MQDSAESVQERKQQELQRSLWDLGLAWGLVLVCCTHHLGHWLHGLGWHGKRYAASTRPATGLMAHTVMGLACLVVASLLLHACHAMATMAGVL